MSKIPEGQMCEHEKQVGSSLWGGYKERCKKSAKVCRNGKYYCGIHDPVAIEKREQKREAKMMERAEQKEQDDHIKLVNKMKKLTDYFELKSALTELVILKQMKDTQGKTDEYLRRQPLAWTEAIRVLNKEDNNE